MTRLCLAAAVALFACKSDKGGESKTPAPEAPARDARPAKVQPDAAPAGPVMLNKMKNCPSAIAGAHTTIEKADGAVIAIVIGKDKPATDEIRVRARAVAERAVEAIADPKHTGKGTGGAVGKCPSRAPGASAEAAEIDGGAKLTFTPKNADEAAAIFEMLKVRAAQLNERGGRPHGSGGGGGAGGGHGGHGSTGQGGNR